MSTREISSDASYLTSARYWWWLKLFLGAAAIVFGAIILVWPEATVRVVGVLFGLFLVVNGLFRVLVSLFVKGYPLLYRILSIILGIFISILGIICLRNVIKSALFLILVIGIAWLIDGLIEVIRGIIVEDGRTMRILVGVAYMIAAIVVLAWPALTLATFVVFGGVILILLGLFHIFGAFVLRHRSL